MQISCLSCKQHVCLKNLGRRHSGLIKTTLTPTDPLEEDIFSTIFLSCSSYQYCYLQCEEKNFIKSYERVPEFSLFYVCLKKGKKSQKKTGTSITQNFCSGDDPLVFVCVGRL